jgi:hypothetical protein
MILTLWLLLFTPAAIGWSGEALLSWNGIPVEGSYVQVDLGVYSLGKYLGECEVNRPEILNEVKTQLEKGDYYRKRTRDQKNRSTLLTVFVDPNYMLHILTLRNDACPDCKGTGVRASPLDRLSIRMDVQLNCLKCKGSGIIKDNKTERYFVLSAEDFTNRERGREIVKSQAYANAPVGAEQWVERLISKNPRERLEACLWLDDNYIRIGGFFNDVMPMLKKARYFDSNEKRKIMVWQFWAGKDDPQFQDRAYYRIYADGNSGKITKKGFYPGR